MAIINSVGNALQGTTGTGNFVGANTPTLITPILGVATATSIKFKLVIYKNVLIFIILRCYLFQYGWLANGFIRLLFLFNMKPKNGDRS